MSTWKTLGKKGIYSQPPWLIVEQHAVELPDGRVIPDWPWIITPDYVNVVVQTAEGAFLLFQQMKYGLPELSLALVGGFIEPGESPLAAAQRELLEETGYMAWEWIPLGRFLVDPNRGIAHGSLFLALQAQKVADPVEADLEEQTLMQLSPCDLEKALDEGSFKVLAWATAVALALRKMKN
jgi:ADP-ribose pyrophosphatase